MGIHDISLTLGGVFHHESAERKLQGCTTLIPLLEDHPILAERSPEPLEPVTFNMTISVTTAVLPHPCASLALPVTIIPRIPPAPESIGLEADAPWERNSVGGTCVTVLELICQRPMIQIPALVYSLTILGLAGVGGSQLTISVNLNLCIVRDDLLSAAISSPAYVAHALPRIGVTDTVPCAEPRGMWSTSFPLLNYVGFSHVFKNPAVLGWYNLMQRLQLLPND